MNTKLISGSQAIIALLTAAGEDPVVIANWKIIRTILVNEKPPEDSTPSFSVEFAKQYYIFVQDGAKLFKEIANAGAPEDSHYMKARKTRRIYEKYNIMPTNISDELDFARDIYETVRAICTPIQDTKTASLFS